MTIYDLQLSILLISLLAESFITYQEPTEPSK